MKQVKYFILDLFTKNIFKQVICSTEFEDS